MVFIDGKDLISEVRSLIRHTILMFIIPSTHLLLYLFPGKKGDFSTLIPAKGHHLVKIPDNNVALHIAMDFKQILCMKSADHDVAVCFLKDGKIIKELVCTNMKELEAELREFPIRRHHRSFVVIIGKICASQKSQQRSSLSLKDHAEAEIPASTNSGTFFTQLFKNRTLIQAWFLLDN